MQHRQQQTHADTYNSIQSPEWAREQERRAYGKGERRYGLFEALSAEQRRQRPPKARHLKTGAAYDFAAVAVLDDIIMLLAQMEERATAAYDYEVWGWRQELERVTTQTHPVGGAK